MAKHGSSLFVTIIYCLEQSVTFALNFALVPFWLKLLLIAHKQFLTHPPDLTRLGLVLLDLRRPGVGAGLKVPC
jgi:hypothetical protein